LQGSTGNKKRKEEVGANADKDSEDKPLVSYTHTQLSNFYLFIEKKTIKAKKAKIVEWLVEKKLQQAFYDFVEENQEK